MKSLLRFRRSASLLALMMAPLVVGPGDAAAQVNAGGGWGAWLGCWEPLASEASFLEATSERSIVCLLPSAVPNSVEMVTLGDGNIVDREQLDASGSRTQFERDRCSGWESMEWSTDGKRVYQHSEYECPGPFQRRSSGLLAILPGGDWVSVQGISAGEYTDVRVVRYRPVTDPQRLNAEVIEALSGRAMQIDAARIAAGGRVDLREVIDASRTVDDAVVEGWLIEHGQGFRINADGLVELADADVSDRVIDIIVALSNPRVFAIDRSAREGDFREGDRAAGIAPPLRPAFGPGFGSMYDPWYDGYWGAGGGYYPGYRGGYYGRPLIIVREPGVDADQASPGRLVNGQGYRRGTPSPSGPSSASGSSTGGSTSTEPSTGSTGEPSTPTRTANPRS